MAGRGSRDGAASSSPRGDVELRAGSAFAASRPGPGCRDAVRLLLELVRQRRELRVAARVPQRIGEDAVGEPRVARQQRAVQVRAVRLPVPAALEARLAVVPEAVDDAAERLCAWVEDRAARRGSRTRRASGPPRRTRATRRRSSASCRRSCAAAGSRFPATPRPRRRGRSGRAAGTRRRRRGTPRRPRLPRGAHPPSARDRARRAPARDPARRRRRRGRSRRRAQGRRMPIACTSSSCPRARARSAKTAMLPRSA